MGGMKTENVTSRVVMLGDNDFHPASIVLTPNQEIKAGTILTRDGNQTEVKAAGNNDDFVAVCPFDMKNETTATKSFGFRAIVSGRVRLDMLTIGGGNPITDITQVDKLRKIGILPMKVTDLSKIDNQ